MKTSESIKEISVALNKAQATITSPELNKVNPFHKSKYCDLPETIRCMKDAFAENGLSIVQSPGDGNGVPILETRILHTSGEWIETYVPLILPSDKATMQNLGSCITYARRYALAALCNMAAEDDDDGNAASSPKAKAVHSEPAQPFMNLMQVDEEVNRLIGLLTTASTEGAVREIKNQATALRNRSSMNTSQIKALTFAINEAVQRTEGKL